MNRVFVTVLVVCALRSYAQTVPSTPEPALIKAAEITAQKPSVSSFAEAAVTTSVHAHSSVLVNANPLPISPGSVSTFLIPTKQVLQSAGAFQDLPRYIQAFPGITTIRDSSNASIVRGGNPFENLFVVDKIEVPNINHLTLPGSSGGLVSKLDSNNIDSASFYTAAYDSGYNSPLSSVLDIHTIEVPYEKPSKSFNSVDAGFGGAGFRIMRGTQPNASILISARQSFINLFTNDIGLNGVPIFTNSLIKYQWTPSSQDHVLVDSISGVDLLTTHPSPTDSAETDPYDSKYAGWTNTTGLVWQHSFESDAIGTLILGHSLQRENLTQNDQITNNALIFSLNNLDEVLQAKYDYLEKLSDTTLIQAGIDLHWNSIHYNVSQPVGMLSPYSAAAWQNPFTVTPNFSTLDDAAYVDFSTRIGKRITLKGGLRFAQWGYKQPAATTSSSTSTTATSEDSSTATCCCLLAGEDTVPTKQAFLPHTTLSIQAAKKLTFKFGYARNAQLPPYSLLTAFPENNSLQLIRDQQLVTGFDLLLTSRIAISLEAYQKNYSSYPVSTQYPSLSLATMVPVIGEMFSFIPMISEGKGLARGVELTVYKGFGHHLFGQVNATVAKALFSGSDGVMRPGSDSLPVILNAMGGVTVAKFTITARNSLSSGRAYTPPLLEDSIQQNRFIYDLSQLNAYRGPIYNRLDLAVSRDFHLHNKVIEAHAGMENVLDRNNFYELEWLPRCTGCGITSESDMGMLPDFGVAFHF